MPNIDEDVPNHIAQAIHSDDRLVLYGYGIFETLRVNGMAIEVPQLHYQRMSTGAEILGLSMPSYEEWLGKLEKIIQKEIQKESKESIKGIKSIKSIKSIESIESSQKEGATFALRVTLSGGAGQGVSPQWVYHRRAIPYTEKDYGEGISVAVLSYPRNEFSPLGQIKSTNYMENILAKEEAAKKGAREGIWLNTKGYLVEGTMSNLFLVKEGVLYTPSLKCGCLPGTRRKLVLDCARALAIPCIEGEFRLEFLKDAEEIFLTNALMGVMPVSQLDQQRIPLKTGRGKSIRERIFEYYQRTISETYLG